MKKIFTTTLILLSGFILNAQSVSHNFSFKLGSTGNETSNKIKYDAAGNIYVTGVFSATMDVDPGTPTVNLVSAGGTDIYLAKYSSTGAYVWGFKIGNASGMNRVADLQIDAAGDVIITGDISGSAIDFDPGVGTTNISTPGNGNIVPYVAKYSSSGALTFAYKVDHITGSGQGLALATDASNNIYLRGYFQGVADFDLGVGTYTLSAPTSATADMFFAKYTSTGALVYVKAIGNVSASTILTYADIAVNSLGEVAVSGGFSSSSFDLDPSAASYTISSGSATSNAFVAKYDNTGNFLFGFKLSGGSSDASKSLAFNSAGEIILSGYFYQTVDFDPSPSTYTLAMTPSGGPDQFVAKYSSTGNLVWANKIGGSGSGYDDATEVTVNNNYIYVCGGNPANCDFEPSAAVVNSNSAGAYVAKFDNFGSLFWVFSVGGNFCQGLDVSSTGKIAITGDFTGTSIDMDPTPSTSTLANTGATTSIDAFVGEYAQTCAAPATPSNTTIGANMSICTGATTTLTSIGSGTLTWYQSASSTVAIGSGSVYPTTSLTATGSPTVYTYYVSASTCTDSPRAPVNVTVNPLPSLTITPSSSIICTGQTATITLSGATTYSVNSFANSATMVISPTISTTYTIGGGGPTGCAITTAYTQSVSACTGINQLSNSDIVSIYPNPAKDEFIISTSFENYKVELYDITGKLIVSDTNLRKINVSNFDCGFFIMKIISDDNQVITKKLIKD